jgi:beta-alanine degradation protein BauB
VLAGDTTKLDSFSLISGVAFSTTSPILMVVPMLRSVLLVALLVAGVPAYAQDPVSTDGTKYKVIFENARVRVLEYRDLPGDKTKQHAHPAFILYAMVPFKRKIMLPNGKTIMRDFKAGDVLWSEPQIHVGENVGGTPTHVIMVEMK